MMKQIFVLAGDVSKGYADFILLNEQGQVQQPCFRLDDCAAGHAQLTTLLVDWQSRYGFTGLLLVVESTGGYEDHWLALGQRTQLQDWVTAYRLNARITHHEYQVQRRRSIDDGVSALTIGLHVCKNLEAFPLQRSVPVQDPLVKAALTLCVHIQQLEKNVTQHKNMLDKVLYQYLPFMVAVRGQRWSQYYLAILSRYGSLASLKRAAKQGFKQIKRVPPSWLQRLESALDQSMHLPQTPAMVRTVIQQKAKEIARLEAQIKSWKQHVVDQAPVAQEHIKNVCSIGGMGSYSATFLVLHIGAVERFDKASKLAAFYGLTPRMKKSGDGTGYQAHLSKQGNRRVRCELYKVAFRTLAHEPYLKALYARMRQQGMAHDAALGVLMHKIIRIIYGLLKHRTTFDAGVDQLNQIDPRREATTNDKTTDEGKLRRYQDQQQEAPVSRRQKRQRKKSHEPQAAIAESAGSS